MKPQPAVVVLAAGSGSRFAGDGHKLAQPFRGSTVLGACLHEVIVTGLPLMVVTTRALVPLALRSVAERDLVLVPDVGESDAAGMGESIAAGVRSRPDASGWLMLPADMPLIKAATMLAVGHALDEHPVAYAQYRGRRGHPVGFGAELYSELVRLNGDQGARRLVARYPAHAVDVDDAGCLLDIDTEDDLARLRKLEPDALVEDSGFQESAFMAQK